MPQTPCLHVCWKKKADHATRPLYNQRGQWAPLAGSQASLVPLLPWSQKINSCHLATIGSRANCKHPLPGWLTAMPNTSQAQGNFDGSINEDENLRYAKYRLNGILVTWLSLNYELHGEPDKWLILRKAGCYGQRMHYFQSLGRYFCKQNRPECLLVSKMSHFFGEDLIS